MGPVNAIGAGSEPISPSECLRAGVPKPGWAGEHVISRRTARRTTNPRQYSPLRWPRRLKLRYQYRRRRQRPNIAVGSGRCRRAEPWSAKLVVFTYLGQNDILIHRLLANGSLNALIHARKKRRV